MSPDIIVGVLGAGGIGAIAAAVITGLFSKRKLGAEATEIITKAAAGVVTNLQAEIDRQVHARQDDADRHTRAIETLIASHRAEMAEVRRALQFHVAWDALAIARLGDLGVHMPPAPPLLPPSTAPVEHVD